jgi:hypothetical protein
MFFGDPGQVGGRDFFAHLRPPARPELWLSSDLYTVQLIFDFQLLSFEFMNELKIWKRSSLLLPENDIDFRVFRMKRVLPRILTHRQRPPDLF